jgi:hypothetical protein
MTDPRPTSLTPEMRQAIAAELVSRLVKRGLLTTSEEADSLRDLSAVLKNCGPYADGYAIAKALDDRGWECDMPLAEQLDQFSNLATHQIYAAEKAWAARARPQPPFPLGVAVAFGKNERGIITAIYEYGAAKYEIAVDGDPRSGPPDNSRRIVNFEDVRAIEAPAEPS